MDIPWLQPWRRSVKSAGALVQGLCGMQRAKYLREQQERCAVSLFRLLALTRSPCVHDHGVTVLSRERVIAQLELDEVEKRRSELQKKLDISQSNVAPMKLGSSK
eukprot:scaffold630_cov399-Prasinococcus_capsulatus_cf.AAC.38